LHQYWISLADEKKKTLLKTEDAVKDFGTKVEALLVTGKELLTQTPKSIDEWLEFVKLRRHFGGDLAWET
jgi:hypothetical protein